MERRRLASVVLALLVTACSGATPAVTSAPSGVATAVASAPSAPSTPTATPTAPTIWQPRPGLSWQIQYSGTLVAGRASVVDIDGHETSAATVGKLRKAGKRVICYFNAGGWEDWRPDKAAFPKVVIGNRLDGWPGERWLDIRAVDVLVPIMTARIDECAKKGFDAVDPDNMDGWQARSGFALTQADTVTYLAALSEVAHARGLAIGLKNGIEVLGDAAPLVEFAVNEECLTYHECSAYAPLLRSGKAVFHVEYRGSLKSICKHIPKGFSTVRKHLSLSAWRRAC
ncbi:MAG TPA: endo alpha-1,4 polygalactosaminidase [Propionicimonas sp.]